MSVAQRAAVIATVVLALVIAFQVLQTIGLPFGGAACRGREHVLPANL